MTESAPEMSWSAVTIKYLLVIFNLLFVLSGIIILSVGVSIKAYYFTYETFLDQKYFSAANLLIAIGIIIFFIAFFGCCGALKKNYCMIITFSSLLILICVLEFAAGIAGYVLRGETAEYLNDKLFSSMKKYQPNNHTEINLIWDNIQRDFVCCGVNGPKDWMNANLSSTAGQIPMSCCYVPSGTVGSYNCTEASVDYLHTTGCVVAFGEFVAEHAYTIGGVGLGFAAMQVLGILFSCHLSKKVRENYEFM